jgi:hypothetical protein
MNEIFYNSIEKIFLILILKANKKRWIESVLNNSKTCDPIMQILMKYKFEIKKTNLKII